jgi:hypothetical protein
MFAAMATAIEERFQELLSGGLNLGQPVGGEQTLYDGASMQVYEFGRIYFDPVIGTPFEVHGLILEAYLNAFAELGALGYPTSDEGDDPSVLLGRMNTFAWGEIRFDPAHGAKVLPDTTGLEFVPRVVVKLVDGVNIGLDDGEETDIAGIGSVLGSAARTPVFAAVAALLGPTPLRRVFDSVFAEDLIQTVDEAKAADPTYDPPDLLQFLELDVPTGVDPESVAALLESWEGVVEEAYVSSTPSDPGVVGTTNPLFAQQTHLAPAPTGIGVQSAWAHGADGSGIRFIDIELGWFLGHEDLVPNTITLLDGVNVPTSHGHGTAVLGTVIGKDNNLGGVGIAPAAPTDLFSWALPGQVPGRRLRKTLASRILHTAVILQKGDVVLVEVQFDATIGGSVHSAPVEIETDVFEAIRLATARGVVVVEAAGNGAADLDTFVDRRGRHLLSPNHPGEFRQSGAILVGACTSTFPRRTHPVSNRGSRVDCHALGDHLVTSGSFAQPDNPFLYFTAPSPDVGDVPFGHTSGAAAIVAGVCLLVQHLRSLLPPADGTTGRLGAAGMRRVLRSDANGTPSFLTSDKIGPMPDLAKIITNEFVEIG